MPYLNSPINKKSYYSKKTSLRCVCNKLEIVTLGGEIAKTDGFLLWESGLREPGTGGCLSAATLSQPFLWLFFLPVQSLFLFSLLILMTTTGTTCDCSVTARCTLKIYSNFPNIHTDIILDPVCLFKGQSSC